MTKLLQEFEKREKEEVKHCLQKEGELNGTTTGTRDKTRMLFGDAMKAEPLKKKRTLDLDKVLLRGKKMVSASLNKHGGDKTKEKRKEEENIAACRKKKENHISRQISVLANRKQAEISPNLKELAAENLIREKGARSIGSGTFGNCYLGRFCGIQVVIKELKDVVSDGSSSLSCQQSEAKHKACMLLKLVDQTEYRYCLGFN